MVGWGGIRVTKHIAAERVMIAVRRLSRSNNQLFADFLLLKFDGLKTNGSIEVTNTSTRQAIDLLMKVERSDGTEIIQGYPNFNPFASDPWRVAEYGRTGPLSNIDGATFRKILDTSSDIPRRVTLKPDYKNIMAPSLLSRKKTGAMRIPLREIAIWSARGRSFEDSVDVSTVETWFIETFNILPEERSAFFSEEERGQEDVFKPGHPDVNILAELLAASFPPRRFEHRAPDPDELAPVDADVDAERLEQAHDELPDDLLGLIRNELVIPDVTIRQLLAHLRLGKNIILTGPPGTGKSTLAERLAQLSADPELRRLGIDLPACDGRIATTATADWTTFDTIGGYVPSPTSTGLEFREGLFLQAIAQNKWLIIDELNRADADKAFGQLFTVLSGQSVDLPYKATSSGRNLSIERNKTVSESFKDETTEAYKIGQDWRIIASMNTVDRSHLFQLSSAFVRRFAIVHIPVPTLQEMEGWLSSRDLDAWALERVRKLIVALQKDRPIGPAILQDLIEYLAHRLAAITQSDLQRYNMPIDVNGVPDGADAVVVDDDRHAPEDPFLEAVVAFILPQMEGLDVETLLRIRQDLESVVLGSSVRELTRHFRDLFLVS